MIDQTTLDKTLTTCLWFDGQAEEAARFYTELFGGTTDDRTDYPADAPGEEGSAMTVDFEIFGQRFVGLNGGPRYSFTEAISFQIPCETQAEIDRYWDALTADGGEEGPCGWCKDKFGVSWQVIPSRMGEWFGGDNAAQVNQVMQQMRKLDIAALQQAADGA